MPCRHGEALECAAAQWTPGARRALRFDNHIKVPATSVGAREKGPLAGFNPPKLGSLTLSPVREGGQQASICQPPRAGLPGLPGLIFYRKQREKRSGPGHHGERRFGKLHKHLAGRCGRICLLAETCKIKESHGHWLAPLFPGLPRFVQRQKLRRARERRFWFVWRETAEVTEWRG